MYKLYLKNIYRWYLIVGPFNSKSKDLKKYQRYNCQNNTVNKTMIMKVTNVCPLCYNFAPSQGGGGKKMCGRYTRIYLLSPSGKKLKSDPYCLFSLIMCIFLIIWESLFKTALIRFSIGPSPFIMIRFISSRIK